jgi:hypothetical protein
MPVIERESMRVGDATMLLTCNGPAFGVVLSRSVMGFVFVLFQNHRAIVPALIVPEAVALSGREALTQYEVELG